MEAICSSETLVDTQRTTRRYIPEDGTLQILHSFSFHAHHVLWIGVSVAFSYILCVDVMHAFRFCQFVLRVQSPFPFLFDCHNEILRCARAKETYIKHFLLNIQFKACYRFLH
jgi:hypothetical protein